MKTILIAKCWQCETEIEMSTPDYLVDELFCYDCCMDMAGY